MDIASRKIVLNCLYAIVLFLSLTSAVQMVMYSLSIIISAYMYFDVEFALAVIYSIASLAGLAVFVIAFFTDKISVKALAITQSIIIAVLFIAFIVAASSVSASFASLQQSVNFSVLLAVHLYQHYIYNKKGDSNNV